jgi:hypothetical protein
VNAVLLEYMTLNELANTPLDEQINAGNPAMLMALYNSIVANPGLQLL